MRLSGELPCDPNYFVAPPVIDYNWLTPGEAKEMHPMSLFSQIMIKYLSTKVHVSQNCSSCEASRFPIKDSFERERAEPISGLSCFSHCTTTSPLYQLAVTLDNHLVQWCARRKN